MNTYYVTLLEPDGKMLTTEKIVAESYTHNAGGAGFTTFVEGQAGKPVIASFKTDLIQAIRTTPKALPVDEPVVEPVIESEPVLEPVQ